MKKSSILILLALGLAASVASANPPAANDRPEPKGKGGPGNRAALKERLLHKFDADGDGVLSAAERKAMHEARRQHGGGHGPGAKGQGKGGPGGGRR